MPSLVEMSGERFGSWLVISRAENAVTKGCQETCWLCRCGCGKEVVVRARNLRRGTSTGCTKCRQKKLVNSQSPMVRLFARYRNSARNRGYSWNITLEQFSSLIHLDCYYCERKPSQKVKSLGQKWRGDYLYTGLDRVENSIGYDISNVVPCCSTCNYAKRDMSQSEFLDWACIVAKCRSRFVPIEG